MDSKKHVSTPFQTPGYEDMELSTQMVIAEALQRGLTVEILDRKENFIRLSKKDHIEYVKDATRTSKDSYITSFVLGNKLVSKQILHEAGIRVPVGKSYETKESAVADYAPFSKRKCVIKPKNTNFGIGISILESPFALQTFIAAVETAFAEDNSILIEEFIQGIECRFLVIQGKTVAVLHRVPANVKGDGTHTIQELVAIKNQHPFRGEGYKTPLEKIVLGETELQMLSAQKRTPTTIPAQDEIIYLRKNSNISTGGDSLDYTDRVHPAYKQIAEKAAAAASAQICGIDLILSDPNAAPLPQNHAIIELNYNPVLYFHDFPMEGENHHVEKAVLDLLDF